MSHRHYFQGCYSAHRAAALSGVPASTVYDWARKGIVVPSVSNERGKLWSYADLMTLRVVAWLRGRKSDGQVRSAPMSQVRAAFVELSRQDIDLWDNSREPTSVLYVEPGGRIVIHTDTSPSSSDQGILPDTLDLLAPFGHGVGWP